jgi:hypothetical protein
MPRWFSGIIRPSGFLTQEYTSFGLGEVPRSIRGWGLFAVIIVYLGLLLVSKWSRYQFCGIVISWGISGENEDTATSNST